MHPRSIRILFLAATLVLTLSAAASAHPGHDTDDGLDQFDRDPAAGLEELDAAQADVISESPFGDVTKNLSDAGHGARLEANATTDVWAHGLYAYTGTFNSPCGGEEGAGVWVWDVRNKNKPVNVGVIESPIGSRSNDVKVATLNSGDILVHSNEACAAGGVGGVEIYDVSDPTAPVHLSSIRLEDPSLGIQNDPFLRSFLGSPGVHNQWLFTQGDRDYMALNAGTWTGNFQIFDITDPTDPELISFWGAEQLCEGAFCLEDPYANNSPEEMFDLVVNWLLGGFGDSSNRLLHDITISDDGTLAYLSNWDAGLVLLDISDPASPVFVSTALEPAGSLDGEVNSHAAWPSADGSVVVETEEDFDVFASLEAFAGTFGNSPDNNIPGVGVNTRIGDAFEANPGNNVTVRAAAAGDDVSTDSVVVVNSGPLTDNIYEALEFSGSQPKLADTGPVTGDAVWIGLACDAPTTENAEVIKPGDIAVARRGDCLFATKLATAQALGASAIVIANNVGDSVWGGVRIWDYSDPANPQLASTFNTVCSANPSADECDPRGTYSVHNVIVEGDKAYFSWYSDGVLILDISDPSNPVEIARWHRASSAFEESNGGIQNVWGVYKVRDKPWIYASDRNGGLYILKEYGAGSARTGKP